MKLTDLKTLHMTNPLGIDVNPYFSWIIKSDERNVMQTAYRIVVECEDGTAVWDTGRLESDRSTFVEYAGDAFSSRHIYTWTVTVWDNKGNQANASAQFETALLNGSDWRAQWAESTLPRKKSKAGFGKQPPATMFRKAFCLKQEIKKARLYATCHGVYRLTLNGARPDDREFAPEHTVYGKYLCYQTYDVTGLVRRGDNALGMYVGDGWYCGPRSKPSIKPFKPAHAVLFQLEVTYADGAMETIVSDGSVKTSYGPVLSSDLFAGENYDARLTQRGWDRADFADGVWKNAIIADYGYANLVAQLGQPVSAVLTLSAVSVAASPRGEKIVDFGQVFAGRVRMRVHAPEGTAITLDHTETLDPYGNYFNNIIAPVGGGCEQRDVYVSDGSDTVWEPLFTFHGFRYVRVTGPAEVRPEDFTAVVLSTKMDNAGTFECSDARLNRLYENTRWSQRSNMLSIPTDCPQREKAGWTGDIQIYATTALLNEDTTPFLTRWLHNLTCDQHADGGVPFVVPNVGMYRGLANICGMLFGNKGSVASAGWGDAAVIVPYCMYQVTGNTAILKQQYDSMKRWCGYVIHTAKTRRGKGSRLPDEIEQYLWNTGFHFGEWLIPSLSKSGYGRNALKAVKVSLKYTAPVFAYYSVSSMAEIARILENENDAAYYAAMAAKIKDAFGRGVISERGDMPMELMGAYVLALYFDLVPERTKRHFADKLVKMIQDNGGCLDTGFLATPFLLDVLCKIGRQDMAYEVLYQEKCPSWLYEVKQGATAIWESWYAYKEDGTPFAISLNHYAFGCVGDWMFRYIGGVDKDTSGFKHIVIWPRPDASLAFAKRTFMSQYGPVECEWRREDGKFLLNAAIPCNTTATIILPNGETQEVGSGDYRFSC